MKPRIQRRIAKTSEKRDWWEIEFRCMITLGDSITAGGWSSCRERSWPSLLMLTINELQRVPVQLVNVGIGANVVSSRSAGYAYSAKPAIAERLDMHVLSNTANGNLIVPDLLVIACVLNDVRGGTPVDVYCNEMNDIVHRIREKHSPLIVLVGPYHITDFELGGPEWQHATPEILSSYNDAMRQLAETLDCLFVDLPSAYQNADWLVHSDGVHGNDLGHRVVANKIFEVLASNCSGLALETRALEKQIPPWRDESTLQE
jgi:lysophospholipase L1-like esterase